MGKRDYKQFGSGAYYHVYNRGNGKQNIFLDGEDFTFFLRRLTQNLFPEKAGRVRAQPLPSGAFSLVSYCLMPNHFHFLLRQNSDIPTSQLLLRVCTSYSKYFNKRYGHVGHVFQDQFQQVHIDSDAYLLWLSAYIHQNPTVAGIVRDPLEYQWSSYQEFIGKTHHGICDTKVILNQFSSQSDYERFVRDSLSALKERKELEHVLLDAV